MRKGQINYITLFDVEDTFYTDCQLALGSLMKDYEDAVGTDCHPHWHRLYTTQIYLGTVHIHRTFSIVPKLLSGLRSTDGLHLTFAAYKKLYLPYSD